MADPAARRRSRSEISSADASSDEDDFYDAAEYDGQQASAAAATQPSPAAAAAATAANGATVANTGTSSAGIISAAAAALSHMQVQTGDVTSGAAAASHPSPQPPLSSSRPQSASVEARVAPLAVSTNTTNPVSVDTATPLGPSGSPVALPQSLASAPHSTMTVPPARPPRPSYSLPGSATTTPQSTLKGPLNLSQLAAGMIPPIPARSSPIVSAGTMTHSTAGSSATSSVSSSLTSSPIPAQRPQPVQPRPYAHSQPTSPPGASPSASAAAAAAGGLPFTIKNLDTGETCDLAEATSVFPEVERAMTLKAFEAEASAGAAAAAAAATPAAVVTPEAREEVAEKKKNLGLMSRLKQALHLKDKSSGGDDESNTVKVKTRHRSFQDLTDVKLVQTLVQHAGPVWTVAISNQGDFIATGGQDSIVRVWAVMGSTAARELDEKLRAQKAQQDAAAAAAVAAGGSLHAHGNIEVTSVSGGVPVSPASAPDLGGHSPVELPNFEQEYKENGSRPIVYPVPYRTYAGHKADVIDLAWSKANFLLSASIDKTVRLWFEHVSRQKCLCVFQHADFVTAVAWHPVEDRYFVSGSFDKKLRIWNIPEHRVVEWAQTSNIITAATFNPNGNMTVAGLYNGSAIFYQTDGLKYFTQVDAKNRHGRNRKGKKVTGMQFSPDGKSLLVTTNDSRIRLYDMDDYSLAAKFKGTENDELQIRAWFSPDGRHVICGGENQHVVVWSAAEYTAQASGDANEHSAGGGGAGSTNGSADNSVSSSSSSKPDVKCDSSESFRAFTDTCTSAQFLPPNTIRLSAESDVDAAKIRHLIIAAGYGGEIKLFENRGARKAT